MFSESYVCPKCGRGIDMEVASYGLKGSYDYCDLSIHIEFGAYSKYKQIFELREREKALREGNKFNSSER